MSNGNSIDNRFYVLLGTNTFCIFAYFFLFFTYFGKKFFDEICYEYELLDFYGGLGSETEYRGVECTVVSTYFMSQRKMRKVFYVQYSKYF